MSATNPPRRSTSPVHYDFVPKSSSGPTALSGADLNFSDSYEKRPVAHPPIHPTVQHIKTESRETTDHDRSQDGADGESTATNSSDEFNWDDNDDAASKIVVGEKKAKRGRRLWLMYRRLSPVFRTALLATIFGGILVTPALLFLLVFKSNSARDHVIAWSIWISSTWIAGCVLALIIDLLPRFVLWLLLLFWGKAPEAFKTQLELFMAVSFWLKLALDLSALWVSLSLVRHFLNPPGRYWTIVNRVVQALFGSVIVLLAEKVFVKIVAIQFHQKALAERLHENRIALKVLDKLSTATPHSARKKQPPRRRSPGPDSMFHSGANTNSPYNSRPGTPEPKASGASNKKEYIADEKPKSSGGILGKIQGKKRSMAVAHLLVDQLVDLKDAIGQVALKDSKFNRAGEIGSLFSARRLARNLFSSLSAVYPPRSHLFVEDFYPYFKTEADAHVAFSIFDKDNNGDISKKEMREAVQGIYRERKALSASLKDMSSAVAKLDAVMTGISLIIIIFVCIFVFNPEDSLTSLIPMVTIFLGFSFVFGNAAQTVFGSLIFIFSTHVYDVGDLIIIDDQVLTVKEFGLFATTFRRADGQEVVAPNSLLASSKLIQNMRRSGPQWETITLNIAYSTPIEVVEQLKTRLRQYMADPERSREWGSPGVEVWIDSMKQQNEIDLNIAIEHRRNWQDWGGRWGRRNLFMKHLRSLLEELEIGYQLPLRPLVLHPSSVPPSWVTSPRGADSQDGHLASYGSGGFVSGGPFRHGTAPSSIPSLNIPRF